jgi:DNA-binding transcriptional MerR regulator
MRDDEINELIQMMKDAGVPQAQVRRTLEVLGQAEALGMELWEDAALSEKQHVRETVAAVLLKIFREDAQAPVK